MAPAGALHRAGAHKAAGLYMIAHAVEGSMPRQPGYDDALMFDWRGQVAEATGANAFFVSDGKLHTPTPDCFLDGITRRTVIDLARRRGVEVDERAIWPEELESFEQMFITGTRRRSDLHPVGRPMELRGRRPVAPAGARTTTIWSTCRLKNDLKAIHGFFAFC